MQSQITFVSYNVESLKLRLPLTQWIPWSKGWY